MRRESRTPKSLGIGVLADYSHRLDAQPPNGGSGSARHIGRLGALAVALGIGAVGMALPAIAHADDAASGPGPDRSTTAKAGTSERARGVRGRPGPTAVPAPAASAPAKARRSLAHGALASTPNPAPRRVISVIPAPPAAQPAPAAVTASPSGNLAAGSRNPTADLSSRRQNNPPSGRFNDVLAGAALLVRRNMVDSVAPPAATVTTAGAEPAIRLAVFGDAGNSYTNGTSFYYSPGAYARYSLGASGPLQQAVAEMMRSWDPTDVIQLGDESYNVASSTLLDYNIGQYYNDWIHPYAPPAYTQPGSIYADGSLGGVQAEPGRTQWPYNLYNFPNGFPNPADPTKPGGSPDGVNHYYAVPGNHDEAEILGSYNDASVDQVDYNGKYIGKPDGPDAYDYKNNIVKDPPFPKDGQFIPKKTGSTQSLLDYHAYLGAGNPGNLKPGTLTIGKLDPNGYGMYYGLNLGDAGDGRPLIHVTIIDTSRLMTDAGQYSFNVAPNAQNTTRDPKTGNQTAVLTPIMGYDVRDPGLTASDAWFQDPNVPLDAPSIGREMFLWAKSDLEQSDAVWNIVMGHHPAYHVGTPQDPADKTYASNASVLNFVQGLQDDSGAALFDAYMNGHSHAYARVLEMAASGDGIGTGIPFFTIGDGGKMLDALNLAPYGTDVLSPTNYANFVGYTKDGVPQYNYDINKYGSPDTPNSEAASLAAYQAADPTSVGLSGFYSYSKYNWPEGNGYVKDVSPATLIITSVTTDEKTGVAKTFELRQPTYLSYLSSQSDLSGLYGYGSGAAQVDAGDSYLMVHYKTAQPVDPAITLIGRGQGVTDFGPSTLFYNQWSPTTAKVNDLAMFSFDVDGTGSLTNVQLVSRGNGYFESDLAGSSYLDTTQDFEILGNNPPNPLGFNTSDPTRAVVRLTFSGGQLTGATLVEPGSGYKQVANAILQCNNCTNGTAQTTATDKNKSLLVGLNIDLEAQYNLAATRPNGSAPYQDWYLMTDTAMSGSSAGTGGAFGKVGLSLSPTSSQARQILATTPLTTGYTGRGPQRSYDVPQAGQVRLRDSLGQLVGTATLELGSATVTLDRLAAPGALTVEFDGDATSSYQVNFRGIDAADNVTLGLNYGTWSGTVAQQGSQLVLADTQTVQVMRTDSGRGLVNFGLTNGDASKMLVRRAVGAQQGALQADEIFGTDPSTNWQSTEGRSEGGAGSATVGAGTWRPTAYQNGRELALVSLQVEGNGALARFAAGAADDPSDDVLASFTLPATGTTATDQNGVLTVRRLSGLADGLALYEADPLTGAVVDSKGRTRLPGQIGYLKAALDNAKQLGLVLGPADMPGFGQTAVRTDLPIQTDRNYGALLLVNGSERKLLSSYSAANPLRSQQSLSLIAPGRGVSFGFEDRRPWQLGSDRDFNDVIVTLTPAVPTLIA